MSKKQTAVDWLIEQVNSEQYQKAFGQTYISIAIIEQAKAMEKEQIVDTVDCFASEWELYDGEQYYNETFKLE